MQARIVRTTEEFRNLENEWNLLLSESGQNNIFLTFDWLFTWWQYFGTLHSVFIILISDRNKLIGIAPFMLSNRWGFRELSFISHGTADYEDIIASGETRQRTEIITAIIQALYDATGWDILRLKCLREDSPNFVALREFSANRENAHFIFSLNKHIDSAPYLTLNKSWEEYCSGLRNKFLTDTTRQRARFLRENGSFVTEKIKSEKEISRLMDVLIEFNRLRRKSQKNKSIFDRSAHAEFIRAVANRFLKNNWLDLTVMRNSHSIAAIHLGLLYGGNFYYYLPAFNNDFQRYSIGRLLLFDLMKNCFDCGIAKFDFMLGEEDYKKDYNPQLEPLYFMDIYPRTVSGYTAYLGFNRLNKFIKRVLNRKW